MKSSFSLDEEERQLLLLGLAIMVNEHPGFEDAASNAAQTLGGGEMFEEFRRCNSAHGILDR
jgi:hypothetical protein